MAHERSRRATTSLRSRSAREPGLVTWGWAAAPSPTQPPAPSPYSGHSSRARSASPVATEVSSSPPVTFPSPNRSMKICRTAGTNDEPPVRKTRSISVERQARSGHQPVDAARHRLELRRNPFFEVGAGHLLADRDRPRLEHELRFGRRRQLELRPHHRLVQLVSELQLDQQDERLEPFGRRRGALDPLQHLQRLRRLQERQIMPPLEPLVRPARDRQELVRRREVFAASPEPRRDQVADDPLVERVARHRHAIGADDVGGAAAAGADAGPDRDDREVAGAAAEVADENQLVALQPRLVRVRGGDRLVLEDDFVEAGEADRRHQPIRRERVELGIGRNREVHRAAEDDPPRLRPRSERRAVRSCASRSAQSASRACSAASRSPVPSNVVSAR